MLPVKKSGYQFASGLVSFSLPTFVCCSLAFHLLGFGLFLSCSLRSFVPRRGRVAFVATWPRNRFAVLSRTRLSKPSFSDSWRQSPSLKVCCWSTIRSCCGNGGQFLMPCKFRGNMSWSASSRLHRFAAPLPCSFPGTPCGCIPFFGGSFFILGHSTPAASSGCTPRCAGKKPLSASVCFEYRRVLIRFGTSWSRTLMALARNCVINGRAKVTSATPLLGQSVPQVALDPWKARES